MDSPVDPRFGWHVILTEYGAGRIDAEDLWNAIDEYAASGRMPAPEDVAVRRPDVADGEEAALVQEQAMRLHDLLDRFGAGGLSRDDLAAEALDILGLAEDDEAGGVVAGD